MPQLIACSVCFAGRDPAIASSLNAGIFVLLGATAIVLGGFAAFIVRLTRRARAADANAVRHPLSATPIVEERLPA